MQNVREMAARPYKSLVRGCREEVREEVGENDD
jgi:hypothetical protein